MLPIISTTNIKNHLALCSSQALHMGSLHLQQSGRQMLPEWPFPRWEDWSFNKLPRVTQLMGAHVCFELRPPCSSAQVLNHLATEAQILVLPPRRSYFSYLCPSFHPLSDDHKGLWRLPLSGRGHALCPPPAPPAGQKPKSWSKWGQSERRQDK